MAGADSVTEAKGQSAAEISRGFFGVQLHYAGALAARTGISLADAIIWHTNFHRLFAYGNLSKVPPDPEFVVLAMEVTGIPDPPARLDRLIAAYALRPHDRWPPDRFPFGPHFACEAPNADGAVRIHFRNRVNTDDIGPLHSSNVARRRGELTEMFGFVARRWPDTKTIIGGSWLYNTEGYCRLFPHAYVASRTPLVGPRPIHGLSTWGQFLDFRGHAKPTVVETFEQNLKFLDPAQVWLSFPFQVLTTHAPFEAFRREYDL
jgi:hypothetical protein